MTWSSSASAPSDSKPLACLFGAFALAALDRFVALGLAVRFTQHMVPLGSHRTDQQQQVGHRWQEDARHLTGPSRRTNRPMAWAKNKCVDALVVHANG